MDNPSSITKLQDAGYLIVGDTTSTDEDVPANKGTTDGSAYAINEDGNIQ